MKTFEADFIEDFSQLAESSGKIVVPEDFDVKISTNIINFIISNKEDYDFLMRCARYYIEGSSKIVVSIRDFANNIDKIFYVAQLEKQSIENFNQVVRETARRMGEEF